MARCCGGTGSCACKMEAGRNIAIDGTGSSQDPIVISSDTLLTVVDTETIDLTLNGNGTLASPWDLSADSTARLTDLTDVEAEAPTNAQVLTWSNSSQAWIPAAPSVVGGGAVSVDNSLSGDGSGGSPLQVREDSTRFLQTLSAGLGLNDAGINRQVRIFASAAARTADSVAPVQGTLSTLLDNPGVYYYYTGAAWAPIRNGLTPDVVAAGQFMSTSGAYTNQPLTQWVRHKTLTTGASGDFDAISSADLTGWAGVYSLTMTPTGIIPWIPMVEAVPATPRVKGVAWNLDGTVRPTVAVTFTVSALLY